MSASQSTNSTNFKSEITTVVSVTWKIRRDLLDAAAWSPFFEVPVSSGVKTKWRLVLRPLRTSGCDRFLNIDLCRVDNGNDKRPLDLNFKLGLKDSKRQLPFTYENRKRFECNQSFGTEGGIIRRSELLRKQEELMPGDILTVYCELRNALFTQTPAPKRPDYTRSSRTYFKTMAADFGDLLKERKNCDVSLHLGDEVFQAHKLILGARSSVFAAMFDHDFQESQNNIVTIMDIKPSDFGVLLDYMYSGSVPELSIDSAIGVYVAADKYDLKDLKSHCRYLLMAAISEDSFFEIAVLAYAQSDRELIDGAKRFARDNVPCILTSEKCPEFFRGHPEMAIEILLSASMEDSQASSGNWNNQLKTRT